MTEETIRELWKEHDACVLRARDLEDAEFRIRKELLALRKQLVEIDEALRERERAASEERSECARRAGMLNLVLRTYDERLQR